MDKQVLLRQQHTTTIHCILSIYQNLRSIQCYDPGKVNANVMKCNGCINIVEIVELVLWGKEDATRETL